MSALGSAVYLSILMNVSKLPLVFLLTAVSVRLVLVFGTAPQQLSDPKTLENIWLHSQYNLGRGYEFHGNMSDEDLRTFAALEYAEGKDPSLVNFEDPPLVKYLFGFSQSRFGNILILQFAFSLGAVVLTYCLSRRLGLSPTASLFPVVFLSFDPLFAERSQTVNLDMPQLLFALASLLLLMRKTYSRFSYVWLGLSIGAVLSSKVLVTGMLLFLFAVAVLRLRRVRHFSSAAVLVFALSTGVYILSYLRFFFFHPLSDFASLHLEIARLYRSYLPDYPWFEIWRILLLGRWRTWFASPPIQPVTEYWLAWPLSAIASFSLLLVRKFRRLPLKPAQIILGWILLYLSFQSTHVVFPRYLLLVLPLLYSLAVQALHDWSAPHWVMPLGIRK